MSLNRSTALTLRVCITAGMVLIAAGLAMSMAGMGEDVLYAGILVLIASPFLGVIVSFSSLVREKDWFWASIAAALLAITAAGALIAMLRRSWTASEPTIRSGGISASAGREDR